VFPRVFEHSRSDWREPCCFDGILVLKWKVVRMLNSLWTLCVCGTRARRLTLTSLMTMACATATLPAQAATVSAASCSSSNVQSAINSAATGDVVVVPAGNCSWSSTVNWSGRGITLQGAGVNLTNITDNGTSGAALSIGGASASAFVTVTGFTFIKSSDHVNGIVQISGSQDSVGFRFHHNRILIATAGSRGIGVESVYGVIDHVTFDVTAPGGSIQSVAVWGSNDGSDGGFTPWMRPLTLGTNKAVYIEDSTFNYSSQDEDSVDAYGGARLVIRHTTFNNITVGFHGMDSGDRRSVFSYEIYENTFTNNSPLTLRGATLRGGTGVIYSNTYGGAHGSWYDVTAMVYRACPPLDSSTWQVCNGTQWQLGSTNFSAQGSRTASTNGGVKFCSNDKDKLCTSDSACGTGGTCSAFLDGSGTGAYPCRDQVGRTNGQQAAPLYVWNNGGVNAGTYDGGNSCGVGLAAYLQAGRDYFNGTQKPGYVAYTYPHPLVSGGGQTSAPRPPTSVRIIASLFEQLRSFNGILSASSLGHFLSPYGS
jgi:hypothetical protein